jgi:transposase
MDFRKKVMAVKAAEQLSVREAAERFDVAPATVQAWTRRLEPRKPGTRSGIGRKLKRAELLAFMTKNPDAYQAEAADHFGVARSAVWRGLRQLGWSHQKNVGASQDKYTETP